MKLTISDLTQDREWRASIGMSKKQFFILLEPFKKAYFDTYQKELAKRKVDVNIDYCIKNEEELLFFTLFSLKAGLTYDVLGFVSGMNGSNAKRNQKIGLDILAKTLTELDVMPKRKLLTVKDFEELFKEEKDLIFDATEQRVQRPVDYEKQKEFFSGKKKAHTLKSMLISTKDKVIKYLSYCCLGKEHDFSLLKKEFPPVFDWFEKFNVKVDLGYLGIVKEYKCKSISIPYKKSKNNPLTEEQKIINKKFASERIFIEHSISGLKRFRILSDRLRIHDIDLYDDILGSCAGLWNFYLAN